MRFRLVSVLAFSLVLLGISVGCSNDNNRKIVRNPDGTVAKENFPAQELVGKSLEVLPDTNLVNQDGEPFNFTGLAKQPLLISFIYTRCPMSDQCPLITRKMKKVQSAFAPEQSPSISLVTVTFDPGYDTPGVLKSYAEARGVSLRNWDFVTGLEPAVDELVSTFKISTKTVGDGQVIHNLRTYLIDEDGRVRNWYRGSEWTVEAVTRDLEVLARGESL